MVAEVTGLIRTLWGSIESNGCLFGREATNQNNEQRYAYLRTTRGWTCGRCCGVGTENTKSVFSYGGHRDIRGKGRIQDGRGFWFLRDCRACWLERLSSVKESSELKLCVDGDTGFGFYTNLNPIVLGRKKADSDSLVSQLLEDLNNLWKLGV